MEFTLIRHPLSPPSPIDSIRVEVERHADARLVFRYQVRGDIGAIVMPPLVPTERADELWKTTCFEAFLRRFDHSRYVEFNFAPSGCWAAYSFTDYRAGKQDLFPASLPRFDMVACADGFDLGVSLDLTGTPPDWQREDIALGLSAIIEARSGDKSYWALAHPPGEPDFHHRDCFAAILRAPGAA